VEVLLVRILLMSAYYLEIIVLSHSYNNKGALIIIILLSFLLWSDRAFSRVLIIISDNEIILLSFAFLLNYRRAVARWPDRAFDTLARADTASGTAALKLRKRAALRQMILVTFKKAALSGARPAGILFILGLRSARQPADHERYVSSWSEMRLSVRFLICTGLV
jgi:O-antigen ligase